MSTGKPPQKTLLGMPSEMQEALRKYDAEQAAKKHAADGSVPAPAMQQTISGNAHAQPGDPSTSPEGAPLEWPTVQPFRPPTAAGPVREPVRSPTNSLNRTWVGVPSDVQAAMYKAQARAAEPGRSIAPIMPAIVVGASAKPPALPSARRAASLQLGLQSESGGGYSAAAAQLAPGLPSPDEPPPGGHRRTRSGVHATPAPPSAAGTGYSAHPLDVTQPDILPSDPRPFDDTASLPAGSHAGLSLSTLEEDATDRRPQRGHVTERTNVPVRRWPALSLIGLALIAFIAVIVVRAPGLLPRPLADLVGARAPAIARDTNSSPVEADQAVPSPAAASSAEPQPEASGARVLARRAAPVAVDAASAALEKQAIDALASHDLATAQAVYEQLRAANPDRPEYAQMLELLNRAANPACGEPGQPACAAAR
jgi:hypothetical protein